MLRFSRYPAKQKVYKKKNYCFLSHKFRVSSSDVKPGMFTEDTTEVEYFKIMLSDHTVHDFTTETNRYAHQVISKYDKGDM
jgi:hypothetical protein